MKMIDFKPFDADELFLDKRYIVGVLKLIERRWKNKGTPLKFVIGLKAFRIGLRATPDKIFKEFWKQVLQFINMLMYENAKHQAKSRGEAWVDILEQIPDKITEGSFDLDEPAKQSGVKTKKENTP